MSINEDIEYIFRANNISSHYYNFEFDIEANTLKKISINSFDYENYIKVLKILRPHIEKYKANGNKLVFLSRVIINNNNIDYGTVDFTDCIFTEDVKFLRNLFSANFTNSEFKKDVTFSGERISNCSFVDSIFYDICKFNCSENVSNKFINTQFFQDVFFSSARSSKFHNVTFNKNVELDRIETTTFQDVTFCGTVKTIEITNCGFLHSTFKKQLSIGSLIKNTKFDFSIFETSQQFSNIRFIRDVSFANTEFRSSVQFLKLTFDNIVFVNFENSTYLKALDLSRSGFFDKNIRFWGINVSNVYDDLFLYATDTLEKDTNKIKDDLRYIAMQRIRETFRLIKQHFKKENNFIDALTFHHNEMFAYQKELKYKNSKNDRINKILLWFNLKSNKFGSDWWQGVKFTLLLNLFVYLVFIISYSYKLQFDISNLGVTIKHFFQFLNITDWNVKPFGIDDSGVYVILFLGRILIGYGYYQTIQAFRKYKSS